MQLEDKFDSIIDQTEKNFDTLLNDKLSSVESYLDKERTSKQEIIKLKKQAIFERKRDIKSIFEAAENHRKEIGNKINKLVNDKEKAIEEDIELETKNRFESIQHIKTCLQNDFPKL